uniref:Uncharacterized protein n=1 Tax=Chrysemys picta bellii TaxID=8478 RepID=A0A8C3HC51_CHRPI
MTLEKRAPIAMAGVGFEEFSVPPGSELALELETEVEFVDGGLSGDNLQDEEEEESQQRQRELGRRKIQALCRRCKEMEQVGRGCRGPDVSLALCPPYRFLMRVLDSYGDDYRQSQLTIVLEEGCSPSL